MRCHRLYPIVHFKNFSQDTLKMAGILRYSLRCGKVCLGGKYFAIATEFSLCASTTARLIFYFILFMIILTFLMDKFRKV